jgi:hypothetical protein
MLRHRKINLLQFYASGMATVGMADTTRSLILDVVFEAYVGISLLQTAFAGVVSKWQPGR